MDQRIEETSVCVVIEDEGQKWLRRLADVRDNKLTKFYFNEDLPWYFANRNRLYLKDGPDSVGNIGVWHWIATPRDTDPSKDFIDAHFVDEISPIEIIDLHDINTQNQLIEAIKSGLPLTYSGIDAIYCARVERRKYAGVLCPERDFMSVGNSWIVKDEVTSLDLYEISFDDILSTEGHKFLRSLRKPTAKQRIFIKSPMEVIRNVVLSRSSWNTTKRAGLTKNEYKHLRDYINGLPDNDFYTEIAEKCGCSKEEAENLVRKFIDQIDTYLDQDDIESGVPEAMVEGHDSLREKYEAIVERRWNGKNAVLLKEADEKLEQAYAKVQEKNAELERTNHALNKSKQELGAIKQEIEDRNRFADDINAAVEEKIEWAKHNAAKFVAEMAFSQQPAAAVSSEPSKEVTFEYFVQGISLDDHENAEESDDLKSCAGILSEELEEAGVEENYCAGLASFMLAAWEVNMPILLAGPNAADIADAFSISLDGRTSDRIICDRTYKPISIGGKVKHGRVITVENSLHGDWIDHIPSILRNGDNRFIFTHPFVEDLFVEPHGLFNYMTPVFTEMFIGGVPSREFYSGHLAKDYAHLKKNTTSKQYEQFLKEIGGSHFYISRIQDILEVMNSFPGYKPDWDYYYALFPYATITGFKDSLMEHMEQDKRISKDCRDVVKQFLEVC